MSGMRARFRSYLPVVIDLETGGFRAETDALLEIGAVFLDFDAERGELTPARVQSCARSAWRTSRKSRWRASRSGNAGRRGWKGSIPWTASDSGSSRAPSNGSTW